MSFKDSFSMLLSPVPYCCPVCIIKLNKKVPDIQTLLYIFKLKCFDADYISFSNFCYVCFLCYYNYDYKSSIVWIGNTKRNMKIRMNFDILIFCYLGGFFENKISRAYLNEYIDISRFLSNKCNKISVWDEWYASYHCYQFNVK